MSLVEQNKPPAYVPQVTKLVKAVIELMVEQGTPWNEAANSLGISARTMRKALDKPHVIKYLRERKYVFREAISAANPVRLARIADQTDNHAAAVNAIRTLERMNDDAGDTTSRPSPGFALVIVNAANSQLAEPIVKTIDCSVNSDKVSD